MFYLQVLDDEAFAIMVVVAVVMTGIITPIVTTIYRPARKFLPYKRRSIQSSKSDAELRVLVCIHTPRNVPTIINLLEASYPTKKSPICVYVLHLVELTGRASAMLIVHNTRKSGRPALNRTQAQSDHIINAFENYEQHAGCVSVQPLTAISPYSTMHEDICSLAEDKRVAFIIIPFHKQQTVDGGMEATNPAFRVVILNHYLSQNLKFIESDEFIHVITFSLTTHLSQKNKLITIDGFNHLIYILTGKPKCISKCTMLSWSSC